MSFNCLPSSSFFSSYLSLHFLSILSHSSVLFLFSKTICYNVGEKKPGQYTVEANDVSSRPIGPGKTHAFTALDHAMGLHSLHVVFYYKANIFEDFDLDPSRVSLSDALSLYPPVTGRISRNGDGNWEVNCNDAGVRIVRASVGTTLDEWLRSADGIEEIDLTVWDDMPEDPINWSPFRIQE